MDLNLPDALPLTIIVPAARFAFLRAV